MNERQKRTLRRLAGVVVLLCGAILSTLLVEVKAIEQGGNSTISELFWMAWAQQPGPIAGVLVLLASAVAFLLGHLAWQSKDKMNQYRGGLAVMALLPFVMGAKGCSDKECKNLLTAKTAACELDPAGAACAAATKLYADSCVVAPEPPAPTPEPPEPPAPTPEPPAPPPAPITACPKIPAGGSVVWVRAKPYGQGLDSTVYVRGDLEFCQLIHGVVSPDGTPVGDNCHLEGWPKRVECEMELLGGACPTWQGVCYSATPLPGECPITFDHFGSVEFRDDPMTPKVFEGQPAACGPASKGQGFFVIAHGKGQARACNPNGGCGPWVEVDH